MRWKRLEIVRQSVGWLAALGPAVCRASDSGSPFLGTFPGQGESR